jgi:hypothetical protein
MKVALAAGLRVFVRFAMGYEKVVTNRLGTYSSCRSVARTSQRSETER